MLDAQDRANNGWLPAPLFAILVFETAALIARSYLEVYLRDRDYGLNYAADLSYLVVPPILLLLGIPVLKEHGHLVLDLFRRNRVCGRLIVIGVLLGITLRCAFWGGLIAMTSFGITIGAEALPGIGPDFSWHCPAPWPMALGILVSVLLIPPIEEIINRGFFLHRLLHRGEIFAVLLSTVLFALFHNMQTIYLALGVGAFLAFATLNSGALWVSTIAHASFNLMGQFDWRCLNGRWNPVEVTPIMSNIGAMATALFFVSLLLSSLLVSKRIIGAQACAR
jgi:membrane protease YdiL (CAAX protease family)